MRNLSFTNTVVGIQQDFDWGWLYKGLSFSGVTLGLNISSSSVGSVTVIDSVVSDTTTFISTSLDTSTVANSLIIENVALDNVVTAIEVNGAQFLAGSTGPSVITAWGQGHEYAGTPTPGSPASFQGPFTPNVRPPTLVDGSGNYYQRSKPQYELTPSSGFSSARTAGAKGDGKTDDTAALNNLFATAAAAGQIVYLDAGDYLVTDTIKIPPGSKIVGEAYPVILSSGPNFASQTSPRPVVQVGVGVGTAGYPQAGIVEWSDTIVSTQGAQGGAILIEWNLVSPASTPSGLWDVHTRIGGFAGSDLQLANCPVETAPTAPNPNCIAAFLSFHITELASGLYFENNWFWTADHDVEDPNNTQITIFSGRGLLVESTEGTFWLYGTAVEHHSQYQYQFVNTANIYASQIQTETAYYQPNPDANSPFIYNAAYNDPQFAAGQSGWGLRIVDSTDILIYSAGLYSFFDNNVVTCSNTGNPDKCQNSISEIIDSDVSIYNLVTLGSTYQATIDGVNIVYTANQDGFTEDIAILRTSTS
jgi:glucan 1,3-beta-glucosidase